MLYALCAMQFLKIEILKRMYDSLSFLPPSNFAVLKANVSLHYIQRARNCVDQLLKSIRIYLAIVVRQLFYGVCNLDEKAHAA